MSILLRALRALARALRVAARAVVQLFWFVFLLLMVILPVPVAVLFPKAGKAARRNLPAEVLRKR